MTIPDSRIAGAPFRSAIFTLFLVLSVTAGASGAIAASRASFAIAPPPGDDPAYIFVDFTDVRDISVRLQKSELLRSFSESAASMLRGLPVVELSLMVAVSGDEEPIVQMAWKLDGQEKGLLEKIAGAAASAEEVNALFPRIAGDLAVQAPEDGGAYYRLDQWDAFVSSNGELLIFASTQDALKRSILASENGNRRFSPKRKQNGRNSIIVDLGNEFSGYVAKELAVFAGALADKRIEFEGDLRLRPGGWEFDLFTNVFESFYGKRFSERSVKRPPGAFFRAGGGKLVAAMDSIPNGDQYADNSYLSPISWVLGARADGLATEMSELIGPDQVREVMLGLSSADRVSFAMTAAENGDGPRGYVTVSGYGSAAIKRVVDIVSGAVGAYNAARGESGKIRERESIGFDRVFEFKTASEGDIGQTDITAALGEDSALIGFITPSLLNERSFSASEFFDSLIADESALEVTYLDARLMRKVLASAVLNSPYRDSVRRITPAIATLMDFREIGCRTFSPNHFRFSFKTGWLDFEDREYMRTLIRMTEN